MPGLQDDVAPTPTASAFLPWQAVSVEVNTIFIKVFTSSPQKKQQERISAPASKQVNSVNDIVGATHTHMVDQVSFRQYWWRIYQANQGDLGDTYRWTTPKQEVGVSHLSIVLGLRAMLEREVNFTPWSRPWSCNQRHLQKQCHQNKPDSNQGNKTCQVWYSHHTLSWRPEWKYNGNQHHLLESHKFL